MNERIVCMIRGGASGRHVQEYGIRLAKEQGTRLVYLHVVDIVSLGLKNPGLLDAAHEEMTWLAWVTLGLAYRRARSAGVDIERVVRYGRLFDSTVEYLNEHPAQRILMGSPHPDVDNYEERLAKIQQFAHQLEEKTGVVVEIVT